MDEKKDNFEIGIFLGIVVALIAMAAGMMLFGYHFEKNPSGPAEPPVKLFTVADKDGSDLTFYTTDGEILTTNKYQWRQLAINHTYRCEVAPMFSGGVANCQEMVV